MSTIRVDNFGPSAGGTTYSARGIAKAWVNFNGTGTIAARDSENVSSLTDNATGQYTINFTSVFGAADYSTSFTCDGSSFAGAATNFLDTFSSGSCRAISFNTVSGSATDSSLVTASMFGDLA